MLKRVFTGSYTNCKVGNLISISRDRGKDEKYPILLCFEEISEFCHSENIRRILLEVMEKYKSIDIDLYER